MHVNTEAFLLLWISFQYTEKFYHHDNIITISNNIITYNIIVVANFTIRLAVMFYLLVTFLEVP